MTIGNYYCYFNGNILPKNQLMVNVTELAMVRGYGVFDFLRTYQKKPFRVNDYLVRLENSARTMDLTLPIDKTEISKQVVELIRRNNPPGDVGIRFLLTGGETNDSYTIKTPNFFILVEDLPLYPDWQFTKGISLNTWEHQRELPIVKTINYLTAIQLTRKRKELDVQDTLYYFNNRILECTRNNVFLFHGDTLITPSQKMLEGITRKTVLELARENFKIEERNVELRELDQCTECFITGSTRGICPVSMIDKKLIGKGTPGVNTKHLMQLWQAFIMQ
jgi:branched-chain amino acid aminotransferase